MSRGAGKNMVGSFNSLVWLCQLLVFMLNNRAATTNFATDSYGDIHFDGVPSEQVPAQTGPTKGEFFPPLVAGGLSTRMVFQWF